MMLCRGHFSCTGIQQLSHQLCRTGLAGLKCAANLATVATTPSWRPHLGPHCNTSTALRDSSSSLPGSSPLSGAPVSARHGPYLPPFHSKDLQACNLCVMPPTMTDRPLTDGVVGCMFTQGTHKEGSRQATTRQQQSRASNALVATETRETLTGHVVMQQESTLAGTLISALLAMGAEAAALAGLTT